MFSSARRWLRRNRTPIAIGAGVIGAGYVVSQYILSRLNDARERMSSDRIAKEKYVLLFLMATQASMSWC
jgi:peroxin-3